MATLHRHARLPNRTEIEMPNQFCELCITCIFKLYKQRQEFSYEIEEQIFSERTVSVLCASQSTCHPQTIKQEKAEVYWEELQ